MKRGIYHTTADYSPKILLLGIDAPYNKIKDKNSYFDEFLNLAKSNGVDYDKTLFIKLRNVDPGFFLTKGKLEEIKEFCKQHGIEEIIVSEALTAQQERNLRDLLECPVFDRTKLILEIFEKGAHSAEGKTQVSIAMLQHQKSRLAGKGIHLSQQAGMIGVRGPGETAKEKAMRHIEHTIIKLKKQLLTIEKTRETQRKKRLIYNVPHMCLIGYTNTGKSSILNVLTKSNVKAEDKLFATLDTTTRKLHIDGEKKGIMSDTVGFIQQLPPHLIEAFKSTLSELHYADLLIHVVDISDTNWEPHIKIVHDILQDLGIHKEMLYVFNKIDKVDDKEAARTMLINYQPYVVTCAQSKEELQPLINFLASWKHDKEQVDPTLYKT